MTQAAKALLSLYSKHRDLLRRQSDQTLDRDRVELLEQSSEAVESVRRFIHEHKNYFDPLDRAAEALSIELGLAKREPHAALICLNCCANLGGAFSLPFKSAC